MLLDRQKVPTMTATPAATIGPMDAARVLGALAGVEVVQLLHDSAAAAQACAAAVALDRGEAVADAVEAIRRHHAQHGARPVLAEGI